ncbi:MAG: ubiquinone/menaquinone biosynthesis C-methylase UbiE [Desulforhopalus sp.]|jgi:ubiquinone/menaquinone biosynthesis C-methylase UbiE
MGDISVLPFCDNSFDCVFSMTALEFIPDAALVVSELNRIAKRGGCIVLTTSNSLSSWAERRTAKGRQGHSLFQNIIFRSPGEMCSLLAKESIVSTAIHLQKDG